MSGKMQRVIHEAMNRDREIAFYARTSGNSQDERMQFDSLQPVIKNISKIRTYVDHGVSAAKVKIEERKKLIELLQDIKDGRIGTLYVYHRDRLARDPYEYPMILNVLYEHDIQVIFTASNTVPFSKDFVVEALFGMLAFQEAKHIQMRLNDAKKHNPPQITGYIKEKTNSGKIYKPDLITSSLIKKMFENIININTGTDLVNCLTFWSKQITKPGVEGVIRIIRNPFYAGKFESQGQFFTLEHVTPVIEEYVWKQANSIVDQFINEIQHSLRKVQPIIKDIFCGICGEELTWRKDRSYLGCNKNHSKIEVEIDWLNNTTLLEVSKLSASLDSKAIRNTCLEAAKKQYAQVESKLLTNEKMFEDLSAEICNKEINNGIAPIKLIKQFEDLTSKKKEIVTELQSIKEITSELG